VQQGEGRLAVSFVFDTDNIALGSFTRATGGTWVEDAEFQYDPSSIDLTLQLHCNFWLQVGTITGGSYNAGTNN
jgi:hypothetical protein